MSSATETNGGVPTAPPDPEAVTRLLTREGFSDPLAGEPPASHPSAPSAKGEWTDGRTDPPPARPEPRVMVEFMTPTQLKNLVLPEGMRLVGDYHVVLGSPFVLGGPAGVGKSRAAVALAVAGATGTDWFGLKVHRKFRTMILQAENGRVRLKNEFSDLDCAALDGWVCVSMLPPCGFVFTDGAFLAQLRAAVAAFKPDVFIIDPWNQCAKESMEKDYWEAFERIRSCLPAGDECPALGIVAHTRKPRMGEKASGRGLSNLLSGSLVLTSVPRSVFVIQPASEDTEDRRIVFTNSKNNDGKLVKTSAWEPRDGGLFAQVENFDWDSFNGGGKPDRKGVTEAHLRELFDDGNVRMTLKEAALKLEKVAGVGRTLAYAALRVEGGEFSRFLHLRPDDKTIGLLGTGLPL